MVDSNIIYEDNQFIQIYVHSYVLFKSTPKEQQDKKELNDVITMYLTLDQAH